MQESSLEPLFSVVIPTHARPQMLREALESVLAQSEQSWEAIVVDDASPTPAVAPVDPRIRVLRNPKSLGPAEARNRGISEARGRYVAFLDDDDAWTPRRLQRAAALHEDADVVVTGPGSLGSLGSSNGSKWYRGSGSVRNWILDATTPQVGAASVARELCPEFDPSYPAAEDLDWWLRLTSGTDRVAFDDSADWLWRRHDGPRHEIGAVSRRSGRLQLMTEHAEYFRTHPRATAFSWQRIALLSLSAGNPKDALAASIRSLLARPSKGGAVAAGKAGAALLKRFGAEARDMLTAGR